MFLETGSDLDFVAGGIAYNQVNIRLPIGLLRQNQHGWLFLPSTLCPPSSVIGCRLLP